MYIYHNFSQVIELAFVNNNESGYTPSVYLYIEYDLFKLYSLSSSTPLSSAEHLQLTVRCKFSELISWKLLPSANHTKSRFMLIPPIGPITMYRRVGGFAGGYRGVHRVCRVCRGVQGVQRPDVEGAGGLPDQDCLQFVSH